MAAAELQVRWRLLLSPVCLLLVVMAACCLGKYSISFAELFESIGHFVANGFAAGDSEVDIVLWNIRFPRIMAAVLVGAALSMAGATYQGMFKNPLVSPDILGVTAGAGLGAVIAIHLGLSLLSVQLMAFGGGLITVLLVYLVSQLARRHDPVLALVLSGIAAAALFGSGISLVKVIADPYKDLQTMVFWMLGALNIVSKKDVINAFPLIVVSMIPLILLRWRMNLLSLDDEEAQALGINIKRTRVIFILAATLMTATTVSIAGVIGWVGLVIPHVARLWIGPDFRRLLPTSLFIGAAFLVLTDTVARTVFPIEVPLGIITAFIGAPFFLGLLIKGGVRK